MTPTAFASDRGHVGSLHNKALTTGKPYTSLQARSLNSAGALVIRRLYTPDRCVIATHLREHHGPNHGGFMIHLENATMIKCDRRIVRGQDEVVGLFAATGLAASGQNDQVTGRLSSRCYLALSKAAKTSPLNHPLWPCSRSLPPHVKLVLSRESTDVILNRRAGRLRTGHCQ
jgi:hypothetical protein